MTAATKKTKTKLTANLRYGWTTGTCATAAAAAAYRGMLSGDFPESVSVVTPSGKTARLKIKSATAGGGDGDSDSEDSFTASVIKDAGDDPDVTHGAEIAATITRGRAGAGIVFRGGAGVGVITRPGLPLAVGEPAINPVPRRMMREAIENLADELGGSRDVIITISVADGAALAEKTWNPRLGIEGGISILGTTGVVRPFSCSAWIASIHRGIDVARAASLPHIAGSTGATSEAAVATRYGLPPHGLIDMGDFAGGMLKYLKRNPVPRITIAGGFGKMVKLAQGHLDLHSARSQIDFAALGAVAARVGMDSDSVTRANTALEVLQNADDDCAHALGAAVARDALAVAKDILGSSTATALDVMIIRRDGALLAEAFSGA